MIDTVDDLRSGDDWTVGRANDKTMAVVVLRDTLEPDARSASGRRFTAFQFRAPDVLDAEGLDEVGVSPGVSGVPRRGWSGDHHYGPPGGHERASR